jgi:hypothetical protein
MTTMDEKRCCTCRRHLPLDCFGRDRSAKDGLNKRCVECTAARNARYFAAHRDECAARCLRYYHAHKAEISAQRAAAYKARKDAAAGEDAR